MGGTFGGRKIIPEDINKPADRAGRFVEVDDVIRGGEAVGAFGGCAVEIGDEAGSFGDETAESFIKYSSGGWYCYPSVRRETFDD